MRKTLFALTIVFLVATLSVSYADWPPEGTTTILRESFPAGSIDENWAGETSSWLDSSNYAQHASSTTQGLYKATTYTVTDFNAYFKVMWNNASSDNKIFWLCSQTGAVDPGNGYKVQGNTNNNFALIEDASEAYLITESGYNFAENVWYDININRSPADDVNGGGQFFSFVNGALQGTSAPGSWDYNSCHFTSFQSQVPGGNARFDEILIYSSSYEDQNVFNLRVRNPIDEDTGAKISNSAYSFTVKINYDGNLNVYGPGTLDDTNYFIVPSGTADYISISVDVNDSTAYYPRTYYVKYPSSTTSGNLQAYLAPVSESGNFIFTVRNSTSLGVLSGVRIVVTGSLPGGIGTETIQEIVTDSAGGATIPLLLGEGYDVDFYYGGVLVKSTSITPTAGSLFYQVLLDISGTVILPPPTGRLTASFYPKAQYLVQNYDGRIDINVAITLTDKTFSAMTITVRDSNNVDHNILHYTGTWTDGNMVYLHTDLNEAYDFSASSSVYVVIDVNATDGNSFHTTSIMYRVLLSSTDTIFDKLADFKTDFGVLGVNFAAMLITLLAVGSVAITTGVHDPALLAFFALGMMAFFVFIGWLALMPFIFFALSTIMVIFLTKAVMS